MGVYMAKPNTKKHSEDGGCFETDSTRFGMASMQGWRQSMEDSHLVSPHVLSLDRYVQNDVGIYGVFDGHGGPAVSEWIARHFEEYFEKALNKTQLDMSKGGYNYPVSGSELPDHVKLICETLYRTFLVLDEEMQDEKSRAELRVIHEEKRKNDQIAIEQSGGTQKPHSLLQALLAGNNYGRPIIRVVDGDGSRYFQVVPQGNENEDSTGGSAKVTEELSDSDDTNEGSDQQGASSVSSEKDSDNISSEVKTSGDNTATTSTTTKKSSATPADSTTTSSSSVPETTTTTAPAAADQNFSASPAGGDDNTNTNVNADISGFTNPAEDVMKDGCDDIHDDGLMGAYGGPCAPENCGAAVIVAVIVGGAHPFFITANAGDSRCVLCRKGEAIGMSEDHKPHNPREAYRIRKAGGTVVNGRVDGNLNLSRTVGDLFYKKDRSMKPEEQKITAYPDVRVIDICKDDEFAILACDGIWDCVSNQEAVDFVRKRIGESEDPDKTLLSSVAADLCDRCLAENPFEIEGGIGCDNMTCVIVHFGSVLRKVEKSSLGGITFYGDLADVDTLSSEGSESESLLIDSGDFPPPVPLAGGVAPPSTVAEFLAVKSGSSNPGSSQNSSSGGSAGTSQFIDKGSNSSNTSTASGNTTSNSSPSSGDKVCNAENVAASS